MVSERSLIRAVVEGDPDALDCWYRQHHPVVYRLCLGFLADGTDADDLAQDAMLHLLDRLPRWDREHPFCTWRNTVVLNLCRDCRRRQRRRRRAEHRAAADLPERPLSAPDDALQRLELRRLLERALGALSAREREAFVLRDLEGMDTAAVAAAMQVGASSVRSLVTLARRRLRGLLAPAASELPAAGRPDGRRRGT